MFMHFFLYQNIFLPPFLSFQPLCNGTIFFLALQVQPGGEFGKALWENKNLDMFLWKWAFQRFLPGDTRDLFDCRQIPACFKGNNPKDSSSQHPGGDTSKEMIPGPVQSMMGRGFQLWSFKQQKNNIFFQEITPSKGRD